MHSCSKHLHAGPLISIRTQHRCFPSICMQADPFISIGTQHSCSSICNQAVPFISIGAQHSCSSICNWAVSFTSNGTQQLYGHSPQSQLNSYEGVGLRSQCEFGGHAPGTAIKMGLVAVSIKLQSPKRHERGCL